MITKKTLKNLDFSLIFVILVLFGFGLIMILSATNALELESGLPREIKIQFQNFLKIE